MTYELLRDRLGLTPGGKLIDFLRYDLPAGIRNLWRWFPVIWRDRDWDQVFLLTIMEFKLHAMGRHHRDHGHLARAERTAKRLFICAELCRRLREDEYYENMSGWLDELPAEAYRDGGPVLRWHGASERNKANDLAYLCAMMRKHLPSWWD